jgi:TatD DNase family protein
MLIDTHIHLQDKRYQNDIKAVLERAAAYGVSAVIIPGTNLHDSIKAVEVVERFTEIPCQIYAAVGLHPTETHKLDFETLRELRELARHKKVVAIGEIGLDYYWPKQKNRTWYCAEPEIQRKAFEIQLDLASELSLPVIIHNREADADTLAILRNWHGANINNTAVLHSYSSGVDYLDRVVELGFNLSIGGRITYKNADDLRTVAKLVPADVLLLETDGPYLTPVPYRGIRNEPQYIKLIAERIAQIRNVSIDNLANSTTQNAISLFRLNLQS